MITDRRKFATKITFYEIYDFYFYCLNQFTVIRPTYTLLTRNLIKFPATSDAG